jgi:predicted small secreted protein
MKHKIFSFLLVAILAFTITSCREKTPGEKIEDGIEDVGEGIEDAVDDVVN